MNIKKSIIITRTAVFTCLALILFYNALAMAWDNNITHPGMTNKAVDLLISIDPSYKYLHKYSHFNKATDNQLTYLDEGSVKEDYGTSADWDTGVWGSDQDGKVPSLSWKSHGYHPITGEVWYGIPDVGDNAYVYSNDIWQDIISSNNPFFHIGRLCHMIEDMTSIAHANADQHVDGDDMETYSGSNYNNISYTPQTVRKPSVDGLAAESGYPHPDMRVDNHGNFMLNVVWRAFYMSTFYGGDLVLNEGDKQPDSELKRMFPYNGGSGLRYDDGGFWTNDAWRIDAIGHNWIGYGIGNNPNWWVDDGGGDYYYIENLDGESCDTCYGNHIVPAKFKVDKYKRIIASDNLDEVMADNNKSLIQLFVENMYPLAAEWIAGFIQLAVDNVEKAHPEPGDVNGDGSIDLKDVITSLKAMSGYSDVTVNKKAEVNDNDKIDTAEVIFGLKALSIQ